MLRCFLTCVCACVWRGLAFVTIPSQSKSHFFPFCVYPSIVVSDDSEEWWVKASSRSLSLLHTHVHMDNIYRLFFALLEAGSPFQTKKYFCFPPLVLFDLLDSLGCFVCLCGSVCVSTCFCVCLKLIKVRKTAFEESVNGQRLLHKVNMHKYSHMHTMHEHTKTHTHIVKLLHVLTLISSVRIWFMGLRQLRSDIKLKYVQLHCVWRS